MKAVHYFHYIFLFLISGSMAVVMDGSPEQRIMVFVCISCIAAIGFMLIIDRKMMPVSCTSTSPQKEQKAMENPDLQDVQPEERLAGKLDCKYEEMLKRYDDWIIGRR